MLTKEQQRLANESLYILNRMGFPYHRLLKHKHYTLCSNKRSSVFYISNDTDLEIRKDNLLYTPRGLMEAPGFDLPWNVKGRDKYMSTPLIIRMDEYFSEKMEFERRCSPDKRGLQV